MAFLDSTGVARLWDHIVSRLSAKVDKVDGKVLSTNDFTTVEKTKLANISEGAEVNQNAFSNVISGSTTIAAKSTMSTLTFEAGNNIVLTPDAVNNKIVIATGEIPAITNDEISTICGAVIYGSGEVGL